MAFLHCHNCGWEQDDFWNFTLSRHAYWFYWKYNPISCFCSYIFNWKYGYWKPRFIKFNNFTKFSWLLIIEQFLGMLKKFKNQRWWTYKSWKESIRKNNNEWPVCPKCGKKELDID
jgi:hypothetical protein